MPREFQLPDLGEGITEAQIVRVLISEGETIAEDQGLFEVETDKAAVEIPSPFSGKASKIFVKEGQTVSVGDVMVAFESDVPADGQAKASKTNAHSSQRSAGSVAVMDPPDVAAPPGSDGAKARRTTAPAAPAVRKLARELGVDIDGIAGSGPGGRVTRADLQGATGQVERVDGGSAAVASAPTVSAPVSVTRAVIPEGQSETDKWGPTRRVMMSQIRKTIAAHMARSVSSIPHVTHIDQVDVTDLEAMRREYRDATGGERRVTAMALIIRGLCLALKDHPIFNSSLEMERGEILYKEYVNIGIAVDTERGLVVPNIRNADTLSIGQIGERLRKIADNARNAQFAIDDLRGGTFTVTNVGALGGTFSTPIINFPEVAILGVGTIREMPVVRAGEIVVRKILPFSFSFDHRVADGAQAARFCGELMSYLKRPVTLVF